MMWHTIPKYPDYELTIDGLVRHRKLKKIKKIRISDTGYYVLSINRDGKPRTERLHRLLAIVFIPNPCRHPFINHKDGDKLNNAISNLEWCDCLHNNRHAFKNGLINNTGENNGMSKLTGPEVSEIKYLLNKGLSQYKISKKFNVSRSTILKIHLGKMWKHIAQGRLFEPEKDNGQPEQKELF